MKSEFSKNLIALRKKRGLTQQELALELNKLGVDITATGVSYWEKNREPKFEVLVILANIFNTSIDELLGAKNSEEIKKDYIEKEYIKKNIEVNINMYIKIIEAIKNDLERLKELQDNQNIEKYKSNICSHTDYIKTI